jgi:hypothetical protein
MNEEVEVPTPNYLKENVYVHNDFASKTADFVHIHIHICMYICKP